VGAFFPREYPVLQVRKLRDGYLPAEARFTKRDLSDVAVLRVDQRAGPAVLTAKAPPPER
jgi:hypothetical protein